MKNRNIYWDTVRWMLLPVLSNVIYEVLKILMVFIVAYYLGGVTDAAIAGKYLFGNTINCGRWTR